MSSGSATLAIVAQVAADDPETDPKMPQPRIVVCIRRPGTRLSHGESPVNICSESLVRNRISPIQMNNGSAASSHDAFASQNAVKRFFDVMAVDSVVNQIMPTAPTMASVMPIHTPIVNRMNMHNRST